MKSKKIKVETLATFIEKLKLTLSYIKQELMGFQEKELEIKTRQDQELREFKMKYFANLKLKIKAMEELEPSDNPEDNDYRRVTINILKDRYKELDKEIKGTIG